MALQIVSDALQSRSFAVATAIIVAYLLWIAIERAALARSREAIKLKHGCRPPPQNIRPWDIWGLYGLYEIVQAASAYRLLDYFDENYKTYGSTYGDTRLGGQCIDTIDADIFKAVHATNFDDWIVYDVRWGFRSAFLGKGVFTMDGPFWSHSRAVLRPQFEKHQVSNLSQFEPHVQRLFANIPNGTTVDLQELFHKLSMDTSTEFLTGTSTLLLDKNHNTAGHEFNTAFEDATHDGTLRNRLGWMYWLWPRSEGLQANAVVRRYADAWVDKAMKYKQSPKSTDQYIFLNELAMDDRMDAERIRDEMLNIMLAGRDTTAGLLSDLFFVLAREPEVLVKLRREVDDLHGDLPTYERLREMKYLKYCTQEALRLYPPVPFLVKTAAKDTVLPRGGGPDRQDPLFVAKGEVIFYNHRSMMRSEEVYGEDAVKFRPERWADPTLRPGWNFLPFGGGARVCLGQQYALIEVYYVVIRLLQEYSRIESRDDQPWKEKLTVTLCSLNGTKVALYK